MHIVTKRALARFWLRHAAAEKPLRTWYRICKASSFEGFNDLKRAFSAVDKVGKYTVFDIGGNKWRIIAVVHYSTRKIYVRDVLMHDEYVRGSWKRE